MWKVAKTVAGSGGVVARASDGGGEAPPAAASTWRGDGVPTNAFQPTLLDGRTPPSASSRLLALVLPMPSLFRAGALSSAFGYGLTSILARVRESIDPHRVVATSPVPVHLAILYTGTFVAVVSNVRYQVLQGIVEPILIDGTFARIEQRALSSSRDDDDDGGGGGAPGGRRMSAGKLKSMLGNARRIAIVLVRYANGVLGSYIAIRGMRFLGLQKLKG
jgi:hypothetical protein